MLFLIIQIFVRMQHGWSGCCWWQNVAVKLRLCYMYIFHTTVIPVTFSPCFAASELAQKHDTRLLLSCERWLSNFPTFVEMQFCGMNVTLSVAVYLGIPVRIVILHNSPSSFLWHCSTTTWEFSKTQHWDINWILRWHRGGWCLLRSTEMLCSLPKSSMSKCLLGVLGKHNQNRALLRGQLGFSSLPLIILNRFFLLQYIVVAGGVPVSGFMHRTIHNGCHISRALRYICCWDEVTSCWFPDAPRTT